MEFEYLDEETQREVNRFVMEYEDPDVGCQEFDGADAGGQKFGGFDDLGLENQKLDDLDMALQHEVRRFMVAFEAPNADFVNAYPLKKKPFTILNLGFMQPYRIAMAHRGEHLSVRMGVGPKMLHFALYRQNIMLVGGTREQHEFLLRSLWKLGYEGHWIDDALECSLSAHEKLELRLSMPREFWPQTWLDEQSP